MQLPDESIKEFQALYEKEYGQKLTWEEARDAAQNLIDFMEVLMECDIKEKKREARLKTEPKGFPMEGGPYSCCVCRQSVPDEQTWYDKNGIKCLHCQRALDKRLIPAYVCKDHDTWYSMWEFDFYFKVKSATVLKFVRQGKLKMRKVPNAIGGIHERLFLIKDNPGVLPRKPRSRLVPTEGNKVTTEYEKVPFPLLEI
jgi:hypothetical protein